MNKSLLSLIFLFSFTYQSFSQSITTRNQDRPVSPYKTSWAVDGPWLGGSIGLNVLGFQLVQNKNALTEEEMNNLSIEDVPGIDRFIAGNYNENADILSYYPFYGSFAVPVVMMLTPDLRPHAGQISIMFIESMATTGALFTITAGLVDRPRPLSYNTSISPGMRTENSAQRSFFAGHVAATGSATFFAAKIYNDFYPNSRAKPYVWATAALVPAWVGYLRAEAGKHFLTDILVGYAVGAASGILVPELHKKENNLRMSPAMGIDLNGNDYQGLSFQYSF